jgi:hypothetical protein
VEFLGDGLDDVLNDLYEALLKDGVHNTSTNGGSLEFLGVTLRIAKPRARLRVGPRPGLDRSAPSANCSGISPDRTKRPSSALHPFLREEGKAAHR